MKLFSQRELLEAYAYAREGGQALHVISGRFGHAPGAPGVFLRNQGEMAHLIDHDIERLLCTAKLLGVRVLKVDRAGRVGQHVDLVGKPLARARDLCATPELDLFSAR